jgi:hypothetical protein
VPLDAEMKLSTPMSGDIAQGHQGAAEERQRYENIPRGGTHDKIMHPGDWP